MEVNEEYLINEVGIESAIKLRFNEVIRAKVTLDELNTCISVVVGSPNVGDLSIKIARFVFLHHDVRMRSHHPSRPQVFIEVLHRMSL
jgi:hypothetical protein